MSESLASSISESMHHQSSWYTSVQAGQKVDFSDVRFPKCYPGFCDKSTVSPHIRSEMIVVQSFCQAEPIPDVPPDRSDADNLSTVFQNVTETPLQTSFDTIDLLVNFSVPIAALINIIHKH